MSWDTKGGYVGACDVSSLVSKARFEMNKEVVNVGWKGKVGKLKRAECEAPQTAIRPEGLTQDTNDTAFNGGFDLETNMSTITHDKDDECDDVNDDDDENFVENIAEDDE